MSQRSETMPHDDATHELIAAARGGDRGAFDALAALHRSRLQGIVEQRLGPELRGRLAVEDVLQETFLRAFRGLARFRSTMSRIHPRQRLQPARPPAPVYMHPGSIPGMDQRRRFRVGCRG